MLNCKQWCDVEAPWQIGVSYRDQGSSIVDRTSFAVMRRLGIARVMRATRRGRSRPHAREQLHPDRPSTDRDAVLPEFRSMRRRQTSQVDSATLRRWSWVRKRRGSLHRLPWARNAPHTSETGGLWHCAAWSRCSSVPSHLLARCDADRTHATLRGVCVTRWNPERTQGRPLRSLGVLILKDCSASAPPAAVAADVVAPQRVRGESTAIKIGPKNP